MYPYLKKIDVYKYIYINLNFFKNNIFYKFLNK